MDTKLAYETLTQILDELKYDQPSLLQLNRTCKKLYTLTCPLLYDSPRLTNTNNFEQFAATLTKENGKHVHTVDLHMVPHRWNSTGTYDLVCKITEKTPDLELLNLDLCTLLSNKMLLKITKPVNDLRILSLNQCTHIGDEGIEGLIVNCPYLQELYLGETRITDNSLNLLATKLILLTHLYLPGCENVTELGINKVIRDCKTLRHIDCRDCYNVVGVESIPEDRQALDVLQSEEFDDEWEDLEDEMEDVDEAE